MDWIGRRGRRCEQLLEEIKEKRRHWKLKEEALDYIRRVTRFEIGYGRFERQANSRWMITFV